MNEFKYKVKAIQELNQRVISVNLQTMTSRRLTYHAGQYIQIHTSSGKRLPFSIANSSNNNGEWIELHIRHTPTNEDTSEIIALCELEKEISIFGPYGNMRLPSSSQATCVLLAKGTGIAPFYALIAEHLQYNEAITNIKNQSQARIILYWLARTKPDLYLHDHLQTFQSSNPKFTYIPILSSPMNDDHWDGFIGNDLRNFIAARTDLNKCHIYVSGPIELTENIRDFLITYDISPENFYSDTLEFLPCIAEDVTIGN